MAGLCGSPALDWLQALTGSGELVAALGGLVLGLAEAVVI